MDEPLKTVEIHAHNLSEAWFLCVRKVLERGCRYRIDRGSYAGQERLELDYVTVSISYPGTPGRLIPEVPQGIPPPTTIEYVESYLPYLMTAKKKEGEQYTYGQYLETQIRRVIEMFQEDGFNTNQAFMTVGDDQSIYLSDPPCLRSIQAKIKDDKLNLTVLFRSWDLWAGFPSNLAAIQWLKQYMASEIGVGDGMIIAASAGLHLYDHVWDTARMAVHYIESNEAP